MSLDDYKVLLYRNQPDGWVAEVPGPPLYNEILKQLGISSEAFRKLK